MYKFSYDMFEHIEVPTCILSNIYHHHIGVINNIDPSTLKVNFNMNSQQEFSFDVQKIVDGVECDVWDKLTSLRYVFVPEHNEYYKADVTIDESNDTVKHLTLSSASEYELSNKIIRNLEINTESDILRNKYDTTVPTYAPNVLYNPSDTSNSILHRALADKAPDWSIIHVDESIRNIQRTFSVSNQKIYDFFTKTIAEEYNCLFAFNSVDRTIAVYDLLNVCNHCGKRGEFLNYCPACGSNHVTYGYGKNTNIFINYNNFSEKITLDGDEDSVKNCFYVTGGDEKINAAVRNCNPNGSSYIYRFSDADYADMPDELVEGLEEYNEKYQEALKIYQPIVQNWYEAVNDYYYYKTSMMPRVNGEHWEANKGYDVGDEAYVKTLPSWAYMECVKAGVTGDKEFDASHVTDGEVINDGTVKWKIHKHIISIPSAEQTLEEIRTALSNETIYFLDEIPSSITLVNNEISNMASLNINNLFRIEIITNDGKNKVVGKKWYGNMKVYNTGDDTDKYTSIIPLVANLAVVESIQEYTNYMTAKVEKRLNKNDTTFTSIFKLPDNEFKEQIKQYSLDSLISFVKSYQACLDVLIANGIKDPSSSYMGWKTYTPIYQPYYQRISWLNDEVTVRQATVDEAEKRRNDYREQMLNIQNSLNLEENLGTELYKTLFNYLREDSFQNSNYVSTGLSDGEQINYAKQLLEIANDELEKACELQVTLSDTVKNLFNTEEFKDYKDRINLGDYIICEVDNVLYRLRLISISYSYSNPESIDLTFSNFTKISNFLSDAQSIINSAQSISLSYSSVMHQVDKATTITDNVNEIMTNGMSSNDTKIINNGNSEVVFDENGILAREYDDVRHEYSPKQMKIAHNNLQFTNNNWETTILTVGEQDYEKYDPASKTWITTRDYGVTANFVDSGYIHGTEIVAGDIYSEGYREGDTEGVGGYGSHINLKDGSFDFAGGALLGWWNEETQSYEVRIKSNVEIGGDIITGARIGSWTVYSDGLHSNTAKITPNGINVEGDVRAQDYYMNNVSLSSILADKQDKIIAGENITIDDDGKTINAIVPAGGAGIYAGLEMPSTNIGEDKNLYLQYDGTNTESSYVKIASIPMGGGEYQKTVTVDLTPDYYHLRFASTISIANSITVLKQDVYPNGSVTLHYGNNDVTFTINGNSISVRKTEYNGNTYDIYASVIQEYTPTNINTVYGKLNNTWFPFPSGEGGGLEYWTETSDQIKREFVLEDISADDGYIFDDVTWTNYCPSHSYQGNFSFKKANSVPAICGAEFYIQNKRFYLMSTSLDGVKWLYQERTVHSDWQTPVEGGSNTGTARMIEIASFEVDGVTWYISRGRWNWEGNDTQPIQPFIRFDTNTAMTMEQAFNRLYAQSHASPDTPCEAGIGKDDKILYHKVGEDYVSYLTDEGIYEGSDYKANGTSLLDLIDAKQDKIIAGQNITIGTDGKTINATDTDALADLADVEFNNLANGQVLKYDGANQKWINSTGGGGSLEYWIEQQRAFKREEVIDVGEAGWTCDEEYKVGWFQATINNRATKKNSNIACGGLFAHRVDENTYRYYVCMISPVYADTIYDILYYNTPIAQSFEVGGATLYYCIHTRIEGFGYSTTGNEPSVTYAEGSDTLPWLGKFDTNEEVVNYLMEVSHFRTNEINGVGLGIDDYLLWGGHAGTVGTDVPQPSDFAVNVSKEGIYNGKDYRIDGVSIDKVRDVAVNGVSVVSNKVANIDLSGKQDTLIAGQNITIGADGKTISTHENMAGETIPVSSEGNNNAIYMQYSTTGGETGYETIWTGSVSTSAWASPVQIGTINPSEYYRIKINGAYEKLVSELPEHGGDSSWNPTGHMYIYTQDNGTTLWLYSSTGYTSTVTKVEATTYDEGMVNSIEKVYGKIKDDWYEIATGGDTNVVPNPQGEATDTLNTVSIDGTIFDLPSGGGGGGLNVTVTKILDQHIETTGEFALDGSIDSYDALLIGGYNYVSSSYSNQYKTTLILKEDYYKNTSNHADHILGNMTASTSGDNPRRVIFYFPDDTHINIQTRNYASIDKIFGLKFEQGGGGGSEVIPNPQGTATDTLNTVEIDGTVYDIEGGGGSGYSEATLWESASGLSFNGNNQQTVTLSDNMSNYDMLCLVYRDSTYTTERALSIHLVSEIDTTGNIGFWLTPVLPENNLTSPRSYYVSDNQIKLVGISAKVTMVAFKIIGIKFGGGGATFEGLDYSNATDLTLPDNTGYTYTPSEDGVIMVTAYGNVGALSIQQDNFEAIHLAHGSDRWTTAWCFVEKGVNYTLSSTSKSNSWPSGSWAKFIPLKQGSSGGGSSSVNYSTEEQVIGTWVDGKPLYQKTFTVSGTYRGNSTVDVSSYIDADTNIVYSEGMGKYTYQGVDNYYSFNSNVFIYPGGNFNTIKLNWGSTTLPTEVTITIRYTKTTD